MQMGGCFDMSYPESETRRGRVQENGAKGLDVLLGKGGMASQQDTGDNGQHQCNKNLGRKGHFLFHSVKLLLSF